MRISIITILASSALTLLNNLPIIQAQESASEVQIENERELELLDKSKGPWEECLVMSAEDCAEYIESVAQDVFTHVVYKRGINSKRIWIQVDDNQIVRTAPERG